jgi:signal transduction histidine kinase
VVNNASDSRLVESALKGSEELFDFKAESVFSLAKAFEQMKAKQYGALVLDLSGDWNADTLIKFRSIDGQIPVVVLNEVSDWKSGSKAVKNGADNWILKDELLKYNLPHTLGYIIEHKKRERDFRDSQRLLRIAVDSLKLNVAILDHNGTLIEVNSAWCEFARENDLVWEDYGLGRNYLDVCKSCLEDKYAKFAYDGIKELMDGSRDELYFEYPCHSPDQKRWFSMRASSFDFKDSRRIVIVHENITDRVLAEQNKSELLEQLKENDRELKDFSRIVSHDLKSPLRGIKMLAEWIEEDYSDKLDEDGRENLELLTERAGKMHRLIEEILDYSRIGRIREKNVSVDLNQVVDVAAKQIAPGDNVDIKIKNRLPVITAEQGRITQLFRNLLDNAVRYMDKDKGLVEIDCIKEGDFFRFSISDNGPGIEKKYFERIFQIFQSVIPSEDSERSGTGLTLAKKIVRVYGGKIWLESEPGKGTTFFFTLPVTRVLKEENKTESEDKQLSDIKVGN